MIIKIKRHDNFRAVARYHEKKSNNGHGQLLFSNLSSCRSDRMVREFEAVAARNPRVKKPVAHVFISLGPNEQLDDKDFRTVVRRYVHALGYQFNQCASWRHSDSKHDHIHILLNQVAPDGEVVPDSFNYAKHDLLAERLEQEFGLKPTPRPADIPLHQRRRRVSRSEVKNGLRPATAVALAIHDTLDRLPAIASFRQFANDLALSDVIAELRAPDEQHKHHHLLYRLGGEVFAASQIDKASTIAGLESRGISFGELLLEADDACENVRYGMAHEPRI